MPLLKVKLGNYEFAPGVAGTVITVLLILLFVYLGFWQLDRMETKKTLSQNLQARINEQIIDFSDETDEMIARDPDSFRFQRMQINGQFLENRDILLDNQIFNGHAGYVVLTPFISNDAKTLILVDRGWIPWGDDRSELPEIPKVKGTLTLTGVINKYPVGMRLATEEESSDLWPLRIQNISYTALSVVLKQPVAHFILQLQEGSPYGFSIKPIYFGLPADRHLGYAVQWFTMALAVLIYYMVINLRLL